MNASYGEWILENLWLFWIAIVVEISVLISMVCSKNLLRMVPHNYILLTVFTICEAYTVSAVCTLYEPLDVLIAALMTCGVTLALTAYAWTTNTDFTVLFGSISSCCCLLIMMILISVIWQDRVFYTLFCVAMVFVYGLYIVIDV
jgi:FtsH-binding integral membrane protein